MFAVDLAANQKSLAALQLPAVDMVCTGHQACIGDGARLLAELAARAKN